MRIRLVNVLDVDKDLQMKLCEWRNAPEVAGNLFLNIEITKDMHKGWLKSLEDTYKIKAFVIYFYNKPVGCTFLKDIDQENKTCIFGIYLYPKEYTNMGIGAVAQFKMHEIAFNSLGMEKINLEVLEDNKKVIELHKNFGYKLEGVLRKNIIKKGKRMDVYLMGIFKYEWEKEKPRFEKISKKFLVD